MFTKLAVGESPQHLAKALTRGCIATKIMYRLVHQAAFCRAAFTPVMITPAKITLAKIILANICCVGGLSHQDVSCCGVAAYQS
jgi:hypothetical protein